MADDLTLAPPAAHPPAAGGQSPVLSVQGVNQYYGGSHILRGVDLQARLGKVTVLLGRNGVGKTTLLKSLMGWCRSAVAPSGSTATISRAQHRLRAPAPASASCPKGARYSRA